MKIVEKLEKSIEIEIKIDENIVEVTKKSWINDKNSKNY